MKLKGNQSRFLFVNNNINIINNLLETVTAAVFMYEIKNINKIDDN